MLKPGRRLEKQHLANARMLPCRERRMPAGFPGTISHEEKTCFPVLPRNIFGQPSKRRKTGLTIGKVYFQTTLRGGKAFLFFLNARQRIATIQSVLFKKRVGKTDGNAQQHRKFTLDGSSLTGYQIFVIDCGYAAFAPVFRGIRPQVRQFCNTPRQSSRRSFIRLALVGKSNYGLPTIAACGRYGL